jgi:RHS repeat-associated protein
LSDGSLLVADFFNYRIRRVTSSLPGVSATDILIPSGDGREIYVFDSGGRHLRTLDGLTGAVRLQFAYDAESRLQSLTDGDGNTTSVQRDGSGNATGLVGPHGQTTVLTVNGSGYLASIKNPANETVELAYGAGGLLTGYTTPRGQTYIFAYDALGRLAQHIDPAGATRTLARVEAGLVYSVTLTTAMGRTYTYGLTDRLTGAQDRVNSLPGGLHETQTRDLDLTFDQELANGTEIVVEPGIDPRWGLLTEVAGSAVISTPAGLRATIGVTRMATLTESANPFSLSILTEVVAFNGRSYASTYTAATQTLSETTPAGRLMTTTLDALGRPLLETTSGLLPIQYTYDGDGRVSAIMQGSRVFSVTYNAQGYPATFRDALGRTMGYAYDASGRTTAQTLPDGRVIAYTYDANSNLTGVTPPGKPTHNFSYSVVDARTSYAAPVVGEVVTPTLYSYDLDQQMTQVTRPDGKTLVYGYDGAGRLSSVTTAAGTLAYTYDPTSGLTETINHTAGPDLAYNYDGALLREEAWSGGVSGSVQHSYDSAFRPASLKVNNVQPIDFQYDPDSLLTQAGALSLTYSTQNVLLLGSALDGVTDARAYNGFGEVVSYTARYNSIVQLSTLYARDALGRIGIITETLGGSTNVFSYTYDLAGRLAAVSMNGAGLATYSYDSNGNRLNYTGPGGPLAGTYDAQDRLTQYGTTTYTYTPNGELLTITKAGQTTTYAYDVFGNLTAVTLPNGTAITYLVDGQNRRVAKLVNGTLQRAFLYQSQLQIIAELDGAGSVVSRFVYASRENVPDYMIRGGVTYRIVADHLGSPRLVINAATGAIAQRLDYDAFGKVLTDTNPGFQPFGFAGGLYDPATGLLRFGARDYDAETGRWTAKDPIEFDGGDTNLYAYLHNDPVQQTDPSGTGGPAAPAGYQYAGSMMVENSVLKFNSVPPDKENCEDTIIKIESETIVKDGKLVSDKITAHYFSKIPEFRCC